MFRTTVSRRYPGTRAGGTYRSPKSARWPACRRRVANGRKIGRESATSSQHLDSATRRRCTQMVGRFGRIVAPFVAVLLAATLIPTAGSAQQGPYRFVVVS